MCNFKTSHDYVETRKRAAGRKETNLRHTQHGSRSKTGVGDWCVWGERRMFEEVSMIKIVIQLNENVFVKAVTMHQVYWL